MTTGPVLELKGVGKTFGGVVALSDLTVTTDDVGERE